MPLFEICFVQYRIAWVALIRDGAHGMSCCFLMEHFSAARSIAAVMS
jgi:hypothetical protein